MFHNRRALIAASRRPYVAAVGGGWTPASVSTAFWFDADNAASITASGGLVSQWNDLSGNARHATQATGGLKFTDTASVQNGKHGLLSVNSAGSNMKTAGFTVSQPFMIFAAFKIVTVATGSGYPFLCDCSTTAAGSRPLVFTCRGDNSSRPALYAGADLFATSGLLVLGTPYYFTCVFNGASSVMRENGVAISATATAGSSGITGLIISANNGTNTDSLNGYYLELFCISGTSGTDITNAETYLAAKWGI